MRIYKIEGELTDHFVIKLQVAESFLRSLVT